MITRSAPSTIVNLCFRRKVPMVAGLWVMEEMTMAVGKGYKIFNHPRSGRIGKTRPLGAEFFKSLLLVGIQTGLDFEIG